MKRIIGAAMNEKPEEEFEDEEDDASVDSEDLDVDSLIDTFDKRKKAGPKPGEPAWRRLERYREDRETAELLSDLDDYDIGDGEIGHGAAKRKRRM
ncbi:MAG TPA: hypothetical protein VFO36_04025 [Nitrospiraceae bacterium]|nr:hypothetical protein [Nitrospiraceae bacterium]